MRPAAPLLAPVFALIVALGAGAEPRPVILTFTGDLMAHARNQSMPDYDDLYRDLALWLHTDDLSFINLETPVEAGRPGSDYPQFNAPPAYAEAALRGGFEVFSLANNHANDWGAASVTGTLATVRRLAEAHRLVWSGLKDERGDPLRLEVVDVRGLRIGFVAVTNLVNSPTGADRVYRVSLWDIWTRRVDPEGQAALLAQVAAWKAQVDVLVLSLHDGAEYLTQPYPLQVDLYRRLVAAGVDILWGHHPHVLQPWAWVDTDRGPRVIFYSLGNFVSRQTSRLGPGDADSPTARRGDGALMRVTLHTEGPGLGLEVDPLPLNNYLDPQRGTVVVPTEVLAEKAPAEWRPYYARRLEVQRAWARPGD